MNKLSSILAVASQLRPPPHIAPPPVTLRQWEEAVGSRIARRTQPLRLERGVLSVRVANAAWANELSMLTDDILAQLHARGLPVQMLRFTVGLIDPHQASPRFEREVKKAAPPDAPVPDEVHARLTSIEDDTLRSAVAGAAAKALAIGRKL